MKSDFTTDEFESKFLSKKYVNIVACFLVVVIALFIVANTMSNDNNINISADADSDISSDLGDEILGEDSTTETNGNEIVGTDGKVITKLPQTGAPIFVGIVAIIAVGVIALVVKKTK